MILENLASALGLVSGEAKRKKLVKKQAGAKVLKVQGETQKKLERIITESKLVNSGRVHLLGLAVIKEALGDKWTDMRDRILASLDSIITSHIGVNDVFFSRSDEEHIIVFANTSDNEARLICAKILQELSDLYLGSVDTSKIIVRTAVGRADNKLLFKATSLEDIFNEIAFVDITDEELAELEREQNPPEVVKPSFKDKEAPYEVVYKPIWDTRAETITTFMVNTYTINRYKKARYGYHVLIDPHCVEAMIGMDFMVMMETITTMDELFQNNFRAVFSIPICYETLFNSDRLKGFLSRCQIIPADLYKYISFTLVNFPEGVPETKLRFIVSSLMGYSRAVAMSSAEIPQNIAYYKECGIHGITLTLPEQLSKPAQYWQQVTKCVQKCKQNHISITLDDVRRQDDLILAKQIGFNYLSGGPIGDYEDIPGHMLRLSWKDLLAR